MISDRHKIEMCIGIFVVLMRVFSGLGKQLKGENSKHCRNTVTILANAVAMLKNK